MGPSGILHPAKPADCALIRSLDRVVVALEAPVPFDVLHTTARVDEVVRESHRSTSERLHGHRGPFVGWRTRTVNGLLEIQCPGSEPFGWLRGYLRRCEKEEN